MKKGLMFVLAMLCMASLVAGMAYSMVNVSTDSNLLLSASENSMLGLSVNTDTDGTFTMVDEKVSMNFFTTVDGKQYGVQPNADYTWYDGFTITNNSNETVRVFVLDNTKHTVLDTNDIQMTIMNYDHKTYLVKNNKIGDQVNSGDWKNYVELGSGEEASFTVHVRGNKNTGDITESLDFDPVIKIRATSVN